MAVQIGSPFKAGFPYNGGTGYVAEAAEIRDLDWDGTSGAGAKQSEINQEFKGQLADLELTSDDLDAIINGVDNYGAYLLVTGKEAPTENDFNVYRYADGDEAEYLCFSRENGNKYYANGTLGEANASGTIRLTLATGNQVFAKSPSTGEFDVVDDVKFKSGKMPDGETDYYDIRE